jgi:RecB family exonuclease
LFVDLASERAGHPLDPGGRELLEHAPDETPDAAFELPLDLADLELASLREAPRIGEEALARLFADGGGRFLEPAVEATRARWARRRLSSHDGVLASEPARAAVREALRSESRAWSASSLERMLSCPFGFLIQRVLRIDPDRLVEDDLDPLERGRFVHDLLETVLRALHDEQRLPLTPAHLPRALALLDREVAAILANVARMPPAVRVAQSPAVAAIHRELAGFLAREAHAPLQGRAIPRYFELQFSARAPQPPDRQLLLFAGDDPAAGPAPAESPSVRFSLPSGREIPLRGKIDRVDEREDGALEIVDYKSGRLPESGALARRSKERVSVRLQLPLYAHAATTLLGKPVARARYVATGARENPRTVEIPGSELQGSLPEVARLVEHALDCLERGWFPSIPGETCCTRDLRCACGPLIASRMRVKRGDEQLERHLALLGVSLENEEDE